MWSTERTGIELIFHSERSQWSLESLLPLAFLESLDPGSPGPVRPLGPAIPFEPLRPRTQGFCGTPKFPDLC